MSGGNNLRNNGEGGGSCFSISSVPNDSNDFPAIGDVIQSDMFVLGERRDNNRVNITYNPKESFIEEIKYTEAERVQMAMKSGKEPPKSYDVDNSAHDETRSSAFFVVEHSAMGGGGMGHGSDYYSDDWQVLARRLNPDGTYNPDGELISFDMTNNSVAKCIGREKVAIVRHMQKTFV